MAKIALQLGKKGRSCKDCTKCCDGWLTANIDGQELGPGSPCKFVDCGIGCTIYDNRPEELCATFECSWRASDFVPEKFSPINTGQIVTTQEVNGIPYLLLSYAGKDVSPEMLSWYVTHAVGNQLNAVWSVDDQPYLLGSAEFIEAKRRQDVWVAEETKRKGLAK